MEDIVFFVCRKKINNKSTRQKFWNLLCMSKNWRFNFFWAAKCKSVAKIYNFRKFEPEFRVFRFGYILNVANSKNFTSDLYSVMKKIPEKKYSLKYNICGFGFSR